MSNALSLLRRRRSRKSERGTTVVIVVMVATLITAIGAFAVHNIGQIDIAVGYSRQSAQTYALAELGTTAAMSQIAGNSYLNVMSELANPRDPVTPTAPKYLCRANGVFASNNGSSCARIGQANIETTTGKTLLVPSATGTGEVGSFGPIANLVGLVDVELTERRKANDIPGNQQGSAYDITLTTTAVVSPPPTAGTPCGGVASMTVKKVLRSHVVIPGDLGAGI
jgi:hypothetical protein